MTHKFASRVRRLPFTLFAIAFLCFLAVARGQEKPQDQFLTARTFHQKVKKTLSCEYLLFLPKDYASRRDEKWPLLLFLHGAGERGSNIWLADKHGPSLYIAAHPDFPFIVLTPQCPSNQVWSGEILSGLLDETVKKYRVDTNRVYLTGLSMGGFGVWDLALACPERFAAVIPIAGGGSDLPVLLAADGYASPEKVAALKSLAFWAFHGAKDNVVQPDESQRMIDALQRLGVAGAKITIYPDAPHNSWERTYNNPEIYDGLLQHKR
jgi:predicted peptidase